MTAARRHVGDKLIIGKFCPLSRSVKCAINDINHPYQTAK